MRVLECFTLLFPEHGQQPSPPITAGMPRVQPSPTGHMVSGVQPPPAGHMAPGVQSPPTNPRIPGVLPPPTDSGVAGVPGQAFQPRPMLPQGLPTEGPPGVTPVSGHPLRQTHPGPGPPAIGQFRGNPGQTIQMPAPVPSVLPPGLGAPQGPPAQSVSGMPRSGASQHEGLGIGVAGEYQTGQMPGNVNFQQLFQQLPPDQILLFEQLLYAQTQMNQGQNVQVGLQQNISNAAPPSHASHSYDGPNQTVGYPAELTEVLVEPAERAVTSTVTKDEAEIEQVSREMVGINLQPGNMRNREAKTPVYGGSGNQSLGREKAPQNMQNREDAMLDQDENGTQNPKQGPRHDTPSHSTEAVAMDTTEQSKQDFLDRTGVVSGSPQRSGESHSPPKMPKEGSPPSGNPTTKVDMMSNAADMQQQIESGDATSKDITPRQNMTPGEDTHTPKQAIPNSTDTGDGDLKKSRLPDDTEELPTHKLLSQDHDVEGSPKHEEKKRKSMAEGADGKPGYDHADTTSPVAAPEDGTKANMVGQHEQTPHSISSTVDPTTGVDRSSAEKYPTTADGKTAAEMRGAGEDAAASNSILAEHGQSGVRSSMRGDDVGQDNTGGDPGSCVDDPLNASELKKQEALHKETYSLTRTDQLVRNLKDVKGANAQGGTESGPRQDAACTEKENGAQGGHPKEQVFGLAKQCSNKSASGPGADISDEKRKDVAQSSPSDSGLGRQHSNSNAQVVKGTDGVQSKGQQHMAPDVRTLKVNTF